MSWASETKNEMAKRIIRLQMENNDLRRQLYKIQHPGYGVIRKAAAAFKRAALALW